MYFLRKFPYNWTLISMSVVICWSKSAEAVTMLDSITPDGVILAGGIHMAVNGTELNTATNPRIVVTGTYSGNGSNVEQSFVGTTCSEIAATELLCESPIIDLATFINAGFNIPSDESTRLINTNDMTFTVGVRGTSDVSLESHASINIYKNPEPILENANRAYTVWTNKLARLDGIDLDKYISNISDYEMTVSDSVCVMMFVNTTYIQCELPPMPPTPNDPDGINVIFNMKIGYYTVDLGRLWYRIPLFFNEPDSIQVYQPRFVESFIILNGTELVYGLSADLYKVQIGVEECVFITLTENEIKCRGPDLQPDQLDTFPKILNYSQIVVTVPRTTIHHQYVWHLGHVRYDYTEPDYGSVDDGSNSNGNGTVLVEDDWSGFWRWFLIGLAMFLAVLCCCCLGCCVICAKYCRRRRKRDDEPPLERGTSTTSSYRSFITRYTETDPVKSYWSYVTKETESVSEPNRYFYVTEERYKPGVRRFKDIIVKDYN